VVWGILRPNGFGDYHPRGHFVGWTERLTAYFTQEMSDEQKAIYSANPVPSGYMYDVAAKLSRKPTKRASAFATIMEHEKPVEYALSESYRSLGALLLLPDQLQAVNKSLRGLIELVEPNLHTFWPLSVTMPKGDVYPDQYFGIVVNRILDSFVPEKSNEGSFRLAGSLYHPKFPKKEYITGLAMSERVIGDAHLWREDGLGMPSIFLSDELMSRIQKLNLRLPKHYKLKQVT
jgi:hypothetical protein